MNGFSWGHRLGSYLMSFLGALDPRLRGDDDDFSVAGCAIWKKSFGFMFWRVAVTVRFISVLRMIWRGVCKSIERVWLTGLQKNMRFIGLFTVKRTAKCYQRSRVRSSLKNGIEHGRSNLLKSKIHNGLICGKSSTLNPAFLVIPAQAGIQGRLPQRPFLQTAGGFAHAV